MLDEVWVGFSGGYDEGYLEGVFADSDTAYAWLKQKHREVTEEGVEMERHIAAQERRFREKGWWLPRRIKPRDNGEEGWMFNHHQANPGHGYSEVYPVKVKTEDDLEPEPTP